MRDFTYHRPKTLDEAGVLLSAEESRPMSGGMSLLPSMKLRLSEWSHIVDLAAVPGLAGLSEEGGMIVIGARTTHAQVANSKLVQERLPALAELAEGIGDPLVRNRGTIGGSIANADPAADYPSAVLALRATIVTSRREIAGDAFFMGLFETALEPGEIITAVRFKKPGRAAYKKYRHPASRFAVVGAFVAEFQDEVRVAVTGAASHAFRIPEFESSLRDSFSVASIETTNPMLPAMNSDLFASAEYRAHLVVEMVIRAVTAASTRRALGE
jgi:carbon-monoxide dehydrogenase medium subunit